MSRRSWALVVTAVASSVLLTACATSEPNDAAAGTSPDPVGLVQQAVDAWQSNDADVFVTLLGQAGEACSDPDAARRLVEVAAIGERWASALADGRPKVQATTEEQLSALDWDALAAACSQS